MLPPNKIQKKTKNSNFSGVSTKPIIEELNLGVNIGNNLTSPPPLHVLNWFLVKFTRSF